MMYFPGAGAHYGSRYWSGSERAQGAEPGTLIFRHELLILKGLRLPSWLRSINFRTFQGSVPSPISLPFKTPVGRGRAVSLSLPWSGRCNRSRGSNDRLEYFSPFVKFLLRIAQTYPADAGQNDRCRLG